MKLKKLMSFFALILSVLPFGFAQAQTTVTSSYPGIIVTTGNAPGVQLSANVYTISVTTLGLLDIEFTASPLGCSNAFFQFELDGAPAARYRTPTAIAPNVSTGFVSLGPVSAGAHTISIRAEGVLGGCNVGTLTSWGGSANVRTSAAAVTSSLPVPTLGLAGFIALIASLIAVGFRTKLVARK